MTTVALRYDVSSNFLARVCEQLNVPRPSRGHWQQVKVGRRMEQPPLPAARPGDALEWVRDGARPRAAPVPRTPTLPKHRKKDARPTRHPLVVGVLEHFERGIVSTYADEKYAKPHKRNIVDVLSSKAFVKRALDVASDLFIALEQRGHRVTLAPADADYSRMSLNHRDNKEKLSDSDYQYGTGAWRGPARPTLVFVDTVAIGLSLFELSEHVEVRYIGGDAESKYARVGSLEERLAPRRAHDWTTRQWLVSGRLGLHAYAPYGAIRWERYWREKVAGELPSMFGAIAKELEDQAPTIVKLLEKAEAEAEERHRKWEIEQQERERREAERRKAEEEKARLAELKEQLEKLRFARDARALVAAAEDLIGSRGLRVTKGGPIEEWFDWIRKRADEADPLSKLRHDVDEMAAKHRSWPRPRSPLGTMFALRRRRRKR